MNRIDDIEPRFLRFYDLMKFRVGEVLLVATPYDGYVLEEDGHLWERMFSEFADLKIHYVPRIRRVSSAIEAFEMLENGSYDLVITMTRVSDMNPFDFCEGVKERHPNMPVVMLSCERLHEDMGKKIRESKFIDRVFYWTGDSKIFLAIVKYVEDMVNVEEDCRQGVQVILVIDDSSKYYSRFLPMIYTEILKQTRYLVNNAVNERHRLLRVRARPKILLAENYEEAMEIIEKYRERLLGVISDIAFPKKGRLHPKVGIQLARQIKKEIPDITFVLQSEDARNSVGAEKAGVHFLDKNSPNLLMDLRSFLFENSGFGAFVFRYPDGREIARSLTIEDLEAKLKTLPQESLLYHGRNNHFSRWFRARTEFEIAEELRKISVEVFSSTEEFRECILGILEKFYSRYQYGVILDFGHSKMDLESSFMRIGTGSLGGKARGIAFMHALFKNSGFADKYPTVHIKTPRSFVVCSEVFEEFMERNDLYHSAIELKDEGALVQLFLKGQLPDKVEENLKALLETVEYPLAVRSSSILEDSQVLPFAGIYKTYFIPNSSEDKGVRLSQLKEAIKLVFASVFFHSPKMYAKNADIHIEEEKMAVLIQELVGERQGGVFYPALSGVAQSYNFYPYSHLKAEDGIVSLALGFGKTVVEGEKVHRFSPEYPQMNPPYSSATEWVRNSQNTFYAIDLGNNSGNISTDESMGFIRLDLKQAEEDGVLRYVASTYSSENDRLVDSLDISGPRVLTFAPVLKYDLFPLSEILKELFRLGKYSFGSDVEIEFAVNIPRKEGKKIEFYFLQIRPMIVGQEAIELNMKEYRREQIFCAGTHTIGNGVFDGLYDILYVNPETFQGKDSRKIAAEIGELNRILADEGRKCILIGFGRLGTSDPWLGIPLSWGQMSQAAIVLEADRESLQAEPSLGSHFYHNLTSLKMGYFHIGKTPTQEEFIDWEWLKGCRTVAERQFVKLVRTEKPLMVKIDGRNGTGVILREEGN